MGPFLFLELQRGYLYQNGIEFRQKVQGVPEKGVHKEFFSVSSISSPMIVG